MMLRSAGFTIVDLGVQVPSERFAQAVAEYKPDVLGMSALLTTTMPKMKEVIQLLERRGLRDRVQIIVGGALVTQEYTDEIGANGYAPDAGSAVDKVREPAGMLKRFFNKSLIFDSFSIVKTQSCLIFFDLQMSRCKEETPSVNLAMKTEE